MFYSINSSPVLFTKIVFMVGYYWSYHQRYRPFFCWLTKCAEWHGRPSISKTINCLSTFSVKIHELKYFFYGLFQKISTICFINMANWFDWHLCQCAWTWQCSVLFASTPINLYLLSMSENMSFNFIFFLFSTMHFVYTMRFRNPILCKYLVDTIGNRQVVFESPLLWTLHHCSSMWMVLKWCLGSLYKSLSIQMLPKRLQ